MVGIKTRKQVLIEIIRLSDQGYKYVVRDKDSTLLHCYSVRPKKYFDTKCWGYASAKTKHALMAYPVYNVDIVEINWSNKNATTIKKFIRDNVKNRE